jgi:hypothetical protein
VTDMVPAAPLLELAAQWEREAPNVDPQYADGQEIFGDHALELRAAVKDATPQARPGTEQQWCVWYGGPDPNNAAGVEIHGDEAEAQEAFQWYRSDLGSGIAVRDLTLSPWRVVTTSDTEADVVAVTCGEQVSHGGACGEPLVDGVCPEHGRVGGAS